MMYFCNGSEYIFSTYVEVFPFLVLLSTDHIDFLHVCGGVSTLVDNLHGEHEFSPRMWRCFSALVLEERERKIFSTYVEVFLRRTALICESTDFLHVCGGVSQYFLLFNQKNIIYKVFSY